MVSIISGQSAFAALKSDGSVVAWGDAANGGSTASLSPAGSNLTSGVMSIASTSTAFAALKSDGSVVAWGSSAWGGSTASLSPAGASLASGVVSIASTDHAFAALKSDGSVVTWGASNDGGLPLSADVDVSGSLASGVAGIYPGLSAFAAVKSDGGAVAWGTNPEYGGSTTYPVNSTAGLASGILSVYGLGMTRSSPYYTTTMPYPAVPGINRTQAFYDDAGKARIATITFASVTGLGATTITPLLTSSPDYAPFPYEYTQLTPPVRYGITATATYTGAIEVCLTSMFPQAASVTTLHLLHYTGGAWVNVTTAVDLAALTACGNVTSLSPFALAVDTPPTEAPTGAPTEVRVHSSEGYHVFLGRGCLSIVCVYVGHYILTLLFLFDRHRRPRPRRGQPR